MSPIRTVMAAAAARIPLREARQLLGHVLGKPLTWLLAHDDDTLDTDSQSRFAALLERRTNGEPLAYLIGYREFYGRRFGVAPGVLIPRPETELLVERAIAVLRPKVGAGGTARVLDMGTGSGCIAISLALEIPQSQVCALDASTAALAIAAQNALTLNAKVEWLQSNWFAALPVNSKFDLIVSNPPYIALADPHLAEGDLRYEPPAALISGEQGLDAIRCILADAPYHLASAGQLWLEHGYDQAPMVRALLRSAGFADVASWRDLAGIERISGGILSDCP